MAAIYKYTWTTEILWRKRDGMATLSRESAPTLALTGFYCFSRSLTSSFLLWSSFTMHRFVLNGYILQTKERMSLNTSKEDICNVKAEVV